MPLSTNRTTNNTPGEHVADHNSAHGTINALEAHPADTTSVHGIADTAELATDADVSAAVATHAATTHDQLAVFNHVGTLTTGSGAARYRFPWAVEVLGVTAAVGTAPTGSALKLDVNKNGTTIFTTQANRPTIADGAFATTAEPAPDVTALAAGDYLTVDRDEVGSGVAGADLTVFIRYRRT